MKSILIFALLIAMAFAFTACDDSESTPAINETNDPVIDQPSEAEVVNKDMNLDTAGQGQVSLEFSEKLDVDSVQEKFVVKKKTETGYETVPGKVNVVEGKTVTFSPNSPLDSGGTYQITLEGAKDSEGKLLQFDGWSFSVPGPSEAEVVNKEMNLDTAGQVSLEFSTDLDVNSVQEKFVVKKKTETGYETVPGKVNVVEGKTVTFSPDNTLDSGNYKITLEGAKDSEGKFLQFSGWSFPFVDDENELPIIVPDSLYDFYYTSITWDRLNNITGGTEEGLGIDLGDPSLSGVICISQYPFEAGDSMDDDPDYDSQYDYPYYIDTFGDISKGTGVLPLDSFYTTKYDANEWLTGGFSSATPTAEYRLELYKGEDYYGIFVSHVSFERTEDGVFRKLPTITDGPYVTMVSSDDPTSAEVVWETDEPCYGKVITTEPPETYNNGAEATRQHAVKMTGLTPDTGYKYMVRCQAQDGRETSSNTYAMRTAPEKGEVPEEKGEVVFGFASDSRSSAVNSGGSPRGDWNYMGVNAYILSEIMAGFHENKADFIIFGGDEIWGMTTETKDYILQFKGWKQIAAPYWRSRPLYAGMGNHEGLWNIAELWPFIKLDKWPYETVSGEAVFASEFYNPSNGPDPSDARRPTYKENVYSFQYGPVMIISINNTYWIGGEVYGGSPWGYIMDDQLTWIEETMKKADEDDTVKYVFAFMHSPVFPSMRHANGAMFQGGNNNVKAYTKNADTGLLEPEALGMIEVRNRMWKAFAQSPKMAAVFTGDEHAYHRTLIASDTPVGIYPDDDTDGDGVLDKFSPNPDFTNPVWHITCGGGGAPYVANVEEMPWEPVRITSHYGYLLIRADEEKASLEFISNSVGEVMDKVDDLMAK